MRRQYDLSVYVFQYVAGDCRYVSPNNPNKTMEKGKEDCLVPI
jgi:hypothetical protein